MSGLFIFVLLVVIITFFFTSDEDYCHFNSYYSKMMVAWESSVKRRKVDHIFSINGNTELQGVSFNLKSINSCGQGVSFNPQHYQSTEQCWGRRTGGLYYTDRKIDRFSSTRLKIGQGKAPST